MKRAAIYARVSSAAQREKHTVASQLHVLRPFVASQGWQLAGEYIDDGRSAKTGMLDGREAFERLQRDAEAHKFEVLAVVDVDRLSRTGSIEERAQILGPFQRLGIVIATPTGGVLDLRSFLGEFWVTIQALVAAEENRKRAERIMAGKLRAIAEGRKPAGPTPFGYAYDRATGRWSIDEPAAALVREMFRRIAGGESCVMIADDFIARDAKPAPRSGWSRAAVYRIVRKRTAVGEWMADKARGSVVRLPPLIDEQLWIAASKALLAHKRRGLKRAKHIYLLEGLATCGHCGAAILIRSASPARNGRINPSAYVCKARRLMKTCKAKIVPTAELDARVWAALSDEIIQPDLMEALADVGRERAGDERDWTADADGYRKHLARLDRVEAAIMARFRRGTISEGAMDIELAALGRERAAVREQLGTAERASSAAQNAQARLEAAADVVAQLRAALPLATPEQRRALLRELAYEGGVILKDGRARLDLRLLRRGGAASPSGGAGGAGPAMDRQGSRSYSTYHEHIAGVALRIRRVA